MHPHGDYPTRQRPASVGDRRRRMSAVCTGTVRSRSSRWPSSRGAVRWVDKPITAGDPHQVLPRSRRGRLTAPEPPRPVRHGPGRRRAGPGAGLTRPTHKHGCPPCETRLKPRLSSGGCTPEVRSSRAVERRCADGIGSVPVPGRDRGRPSARSRGSATATWTPVRTDYLLRHGSSGRVSSGSA